MIKKNILATQTTERYKKIINIINNYKISKFELISNYGLYSGDTNLFKGGYRSKIFGDSRYVPSVLSLEYLRKFCYFWIA